MERYILKNLLIWKTSPYRKPLILKGVRQVGKVNFMQVDPMTFSEFLIANGDENLAGYLDSLNTIEPIPDAFFNPLYEKLKMYYVTGGMPEPVLMWTEARDVSAMQEALSDIIGAYERDFAKHPNISEFPKISMIWRSVPSQLAPTAFGEGNRLFTEFKRTDRKFCAADPDHSV